ncbi:MAG: PmbA/TldA family metallopeptidase, partial [Methanobacteriaceae archaeon]
MNNNNTNTDNTNNNSTTQNLDLFEKIINKVESKCDYADIRVANGIGNNIIMKDHKIQEINSGYDFGARIRVLKNGS